MVTKYIIMCGGNYKHWDTPRHLTVVMGEEIVARTIRLLKENGIEDISISTNNPIFEKFGVPILKHDNLYEAKYWTIEDGYWFNCFYPTDEPVCYLFGDVFYSDEAIKKIIKTETDDIEFFASKEPFADNYIKDHVEPFALKVVNQKHLRKAIEKTKELDKKGKFWRQPIMWELWTVIKGTELQKQKDKYPAEYVVINDYTCDIDWKEDARKLNIMLGGEKMVKCEVINQNLEVREWKRLKNIKRIKNNDEILQPNFFEIGDTFETDEEFASYLAGETPKLSTVCIKVLEVIPEKIEKQETKTIKKPTVKKVAKATNKKIDKKK